MTFPKTKEWDEMLAKTPSDSWLSLIMKHTPECFKSILVSHQPPSVERLESLEWTDTTNAGVFGCFLVPKGKPYSSHKESYLYVGSASGYGFGLSGRKFSILSKWPSGHKDAFKFIRGPHLFRKGKFMTLF